MRNARNVVGAVSAAALLALLAACSQPAPQAASEAASSAEVASEAASVASEAASSADSAASDAASAASDAASAASEASAAPAAAAAGTVALDIKDAAGVQLTGNVDAGAKVFRQCATCHVIEPGVNKVGPSLHGIVGRKAGSVPGFKYSAANKGSGITWTEQEMFEYLENPKKKVPGTIMAFAGLRKPEDRANVIAYLQEKSK